MGVKMTVVVAFARKLLTTIGNRMTIARKRTGLTCVPRTFVSTSASIWLIFVAVMPFARPMQHPRNRTLFQLIRLMVFRGSAQPVTKQSIAERRAVMAVGRSEAVYEITIRTKMTTRMIIFRL